MSNIAHKKQTRKMTETMKFLQSVEAQKRGSIKLSGTMPRNDANYLDGIAGKKFHAPRKIDQRVKGQTVIKPVTLKRKDGSTVEVSRREYKQLRAIAKVSRQQNMKKKRKVA